MSRVAIDMESQTDKVNFAKIKRIVLFGGARLIAKSAAMVATLNKEEIIHPPIQSHHQ